MILQLLDAAVVVTVVVGITVFEFDDNGDSDNLVAVEVVAGKADCCFGGDRGGEDINFTSGSSIIQSNVCNDETNWRKYGCSSKCSHKALARESNSASFNTVDLGDFKMEDDGFFLFVVFNDDFDTSDVATSTVPPEEVKTYLDVLLVVVVDGLCFLCFVSFFVGWPCIL